MKKIMLIILASFMFVGCEQPTSESAGVIQRTDDLSTKVKQIAEDYVSKNFEIANETYSDTVQARFNSTEVQGKENLIGGWHVEHKVFSDISIEDQYAHTNYFSGGNIWTNHWFTWSATANETGEKLQIRAHFDYKWEDGKIVIAQAFFSDRDYSRIMEAAMPVE
jgi:hypothetical protein|tara:strand:- start:568 stop:1062 length:495 start_codon:yes stop_codon:yes gene_type:complete